ncbi:hypothetical protein, partial [Paenibacillus sp. HGF7]|uniref:hypothetical protein n=2 Tax=unclassified Paenibacillus TaxID=185978 RepID=UPI0005602122
AAHLANAVRSAICRAGSAYLQESQQLRALAQSDRPLQPGSGSTGSALVSSRLANAVRSVGCRSGSADLQEAQQLPALAQPIIPCRRDPEEPVPRLSAAHLANVVRSAGCRSGLRICRRPSSCRPTAARSSPANGIR